MSAPPKWSHPKTKKAACEELLQSDGKAPSGRFLIRKIKDGHILSVLHKGSVVHCKILPSEDDGSLLINGKSYGEKFETLDQIVERLAKEPLLPKWPVQLTEAMGVDGETYVLGAAKKKKKKKKKTTTSETKTATTSEPVPDPDPESASTADASPGSSTVDATPPPPAPTIGSVLVSRESPNIDFGFALAQVWAGHVLKFITVVTYSRVDGLLVHDQVLGIAVETADGQPIGEEVQNDSAAHNKVIELVKRAHTRCELTILQNNGVPAMGPPSLDDGSRKLNLCGRTMFCQCPRCRKVPGSVDYLALRPTAAG